MGKLLLKTSLLMRSQGEIAQLKRENYQKTVCGSFDVRFYGAEMNVSKRAVKIAGHGN